jgi:TPR repeat protein
MRSSRVVGAFGMLIACARAEPIVMPQDAPTHSCMAFGREACAAACERDSGPACLAASVGYERGEPPDERKMIALQNRACSLGVPRGCYWYARSMAFSPGGDRGVVEEYLRKACDGKLADACTQLAVGSLQPTEEGVRAPEVAVEALGRSCELGEVAACAMIVDLKALGLGVPRDEAAAKEGYEKVCALGRSRKQPQLASCHNAEGTHDDLWVSLPYRVLLEPLSDPGPNLQIEGVTRSNFEVDTTIRFCVQAGSVVVTDVTIEDASIHPDIDAALADNVRAWRMQVRPHVNATGPLCHLERYRIKAGQR